MFYPPVVIIWCTRVLCIPVIWSVPLVVTRMISVGGLVTLIVVGLIPMEWLVPWVTVWVSVHYVPVVVLGIILGQVVAWHIVIFIPPVVLLVDHTILLILAVVFMVFQQAGHSLYGLYLSLSPGPLYGVFVVISQLND